MTSAQVGKLAGELRRVGDCHRLSREQAARGGAAARAGRRQPTIDRLPDDRRNRHAALLRDRHEPGVPLGIQQDLQPVIQMACAYSSMCWYVRRPSVQDRNSFARVALPFEPWRCC